MLVAFKMQTLLIALATTHGFATGISAAQPGAPTLRCQLAVIDGGSGCFGAALAQTTSNRCLHNYLDVS